MRLTTASENNFFDLSALVHPAQTFDHPRDVVSHRGLTIGEKRAILASWASDASAVASCPHLRAPEGLKAPVAIDDVLDAIVALDDEPPEPPPGGKPMRVRGIDRALAA